MNQEKGFVKKTLLNPGFYKLLRLGFIICLILGIVCLVIGSKIPGTHTESRQIEYVPLDSALPVGEDCTVSFSDSEIVMTIPTDLLVTTGGSRIETIHTESLHVNYYFVSKSDGTAFFAQTVDEQNRFIYDNTLNESITDRLFHQALEEGAGEEVSFYGKTISAPDFSSGPIQDYYDRVNGTDSSGQTEIVNQFMSEHPIVSIRSTSPELLTVSVANEQHFDLFFMTAGQVLIILGIVLVIVGSIALKKLKEMASSRYLN